VTLNNAITVFRWHFKADENVWYIDNTYTYTESQLKNGKTEVISTTLIK